MQGPNFEELGRQYEVKINYLGPNIYIKSKYDEWLCEALRNGLYILKHYSQKYYGKGDRKNHPHKQKERALHLQEALEYIRQHDNNMLQNR